MSTAQSLPDDVPQFPWQAEFQARQKQINQGRKLGLPAFAYLNGFVEYVLASRHFAQYGEWPNGVQPVRPSMDGLSIFQTHWIKYQKDTDKFNQWLAAMDERSRLKRIARHEQRRSKATTTNNAPPTVSSPLGQYVARRKAVRS